MAWTLQDAKNKFSEVVERAQAGEPQRVTKRGRPAVVVVDAAEYERLAARKPVPSLVEVLLNAPKGDFELPPRERIPPGPSPFDEDEPEDAPR
jgi:antitoxin Phd